MKINPDFYYFDRGGGATIVMNVSDMQQIEDYVVEQTVLMLHPQQPGDHAWTEAQIRRMFAPDRYLWGATPRAAIGQLARDCRAHDRAQR